MLGRKDKFMEESIEDKKVETTGGNDESGKNKNCLGQESGSY